MSEHFLIIYYPLRMDFTTSQTQGESDVVSQHFLYLKDLYDKKSVLMAGRVEDARFGLALLSVENDKQAQEIMEKDPAVAAKVFRGELLPFKLAIM